MIPANEKRIATLEDELKKLTVKYERLYKRVMFLEKENTRRKSDISQLPKK